MPYHHYKKKLKYFVNYLKKKKHFQTYIVMVVGLWPLMFSIN